MSILILFGIGIVAGLIAAYLRGPDRRFVFLHVLVGVVGAMVGGVLVARLLGDKAYHPDHFDAEPAPGPRAARCCFSPLPS